MSRYREHRQREDAVEAAREWGRLGAALRGRGLTEAQVARVLDKGAAAAADAARRLARGEQGAVVYRRTSS